ncbi:MAG: MltA domain-containing protein [Desulfurellaceae bacterium]|nr:MltA domain-containing protein [Desulfurellaceae bacterium]
MSASLLFLLCFFALLFPTTDSRAEPTLTLLSANQIPPLVDDLDRRSLKTVLQQSLSALEQKPGSQAFSLGRKQVSVDRVRNSLGAFLALLNRPGDLALEVRREFDLYRASTPVLFTGYHEPELQGSFIRTERYRYPLYRRPTDLVKVDVSQFTTQLFPQDVYGRVANGGLVPYFSRAQIDGQRMLAPQHKELVWLDDPVERFFLHIQGSGKIRLPDGTWFRVGYAASNGWPYRSIGKMLLGQGKLQSGEASAQGIRHYLRQHPAEQDQILFHNRRYIFFRVVSAGPLGSLGVPLTPGRSIAIDPNWYPPGAVGFIRTTRPHLKENGQVSWQPFSRFVALQDRGAAITGPGRADIYWGSGSQPEAGLMAQRGELYIFLKKP